MIDPMLKIAPDWVVALTKKSLDNIAVKSLLPFVLTNIRKMLIPMCRIAIANV